MGDYRNQLEPITEADVREECRIAARTTVALDPTSPPGVVVPREWLSIALDCLLGNASPDDADCKEAAAVLHALSHRSTEGGIGDDDRQRP